MVKITFPDGAVREFESGVTTFEIAQSIFDKPIRSKMINYGHIIDGDCVLHPRFIEMHVRYKQENVLLAGKRIKLNQELSQQLIEGKKALRLFPYLVKNF